MTDDPARTDDRVATPVAKVGAIVAVAALTAALVAALVDPMRVGPTGRGMAGQAGTGQFFEVGVFVSTFNVLILLALLWSYAAIYRNLPNRFTGSLLLVIVALLLYALASNPAVHLLFGYGGATGLGPFSFLPGLFAAAAVVVLLYQSFR
jgi:hypothetical protein